MDSAKKFIVSKKAENEIREIIKYQYYNFSDARAIKIQNSIYEFAQKAAQNPNYYPKYLKNTNSKRNIRKAVIYKTYLLIFEVFEDYIQILSVYHGAMDK